MGLSHRLDVLVHVDGHLYGRAHCRRDIHEFWYPDLPQWLSALVALVIMTVVNFIAVSAYGEFEFWFALVKICTIIS